jgi:hypothetical protein
LTPAPKAAENLNMKSYDPDGTPEMDEEAFEEADRLGMRPVFVICDEQKAKVGDISGVSFVCFAYFVPRMGERITLEDGTTCQVARVMYKLARTKSRKVIGLTPNVYAVRLDDPK